MALIKAASSKSQVLKIVKNKTKKQTKKQTAENADKPSREKLRRISNEIKRLQKVYRKIDRSNKAIVDGLIKRSAFLRIACEDLEADITKYGYTEKFAQSKDQEPYSRERPEVRQYNSMNKNYQTITKQLADFVEKDPKEPISDGFDDFLKNE